MPFPPKALGSRVSLASFMEGKLRSLSFDRSVEQVLEFVMAEVREELRRSETGRSLEAACSAEISSLCKGNKGLFA